jgi:hypothetical protein
MGVRSFYIDLRKYLPTKKEMREIMNLTACKTPGLGKYDLSQINLDSFSGDQRRFMEILLSSKQLIYDWGRHELFACALPFSVDYGKNAVSGTEGESLADAKLWIKYDPDLLHGLLQMYFEGDWGPTGTDTVMLWERSGVRVDLAGCSEYGPKDPKAFIEQLRAEVRQ